MNASIDLGEAGRGHLGPTDTELTGWWAESRKTLTVGDLDFRHGLCDGTVLPGGLRGPGG